MKVFDKNQWDSQREHVADELRKFANGGENDQALLAASTKLLTLTCELQQAFLNDVTALFQTVQQMGTGLQVSGDRIFLLKEILIRAGTLTSEQIDELSQEVVKEQLELQEAEMKAQEEAQKAAMLENVTTAQTEKPADQGEQVQNVFEFPKED